MNRRNFLAIGAGSITIFGATYYALSDKSNLERADLNSESISVKRLLPDEYQILHLASLAPSGHNTQPWFINYMEPFHWIVCNDKSKWLPAVDPIQRETILSLGAFIQNLEYAANSLGYNCQFNLLANTNQDEKIMEIKLVKAGNKFTNHIDRIEKRRTLRSNIQSIPLKIEDIRLLVNDEPEFTHFIPRTTKEYRLLNEQTIAANKIQSYGNSAQKELAKWIRFSTHDAQKYRDGLTTGSMEIKGISGWVVRNFYKQSNVMSKGFREKSIDQVEKQVASSAGWFLITSNSVSVEELIETGMRMQRLFLKVRDKNIGIHPMTQILEEPSINQNLQKSVGISQHVQFILRAGYVNNYPDPVSLRRPVDRLIHF